jgi:hypothetical protein
MSPWAGFRSVHWDETARGGRAEDVWAEERPDRDRVSCLTPRSPVVALSDRLDTEPTARFGCHPARFRQPLACHGGA